MLNILRVAAIAGAAAFATAASAQTTNTPAQPLPQAEKPNAITVNPMAGDQADDTITCNRPGASQGPKPQAAMGNSGDEGCIGSNGGNGSGSGGNG